MRYAHARPLHAHENPGPGDILVEHTRTLPGLVIRAGAIAAGSLTRINHVGVICAAHADEWLTAEAHAGRGYTLMTRTDLRGAVLRVSDDPAERARVVDAAVELAPLRYSWLSIVRIALWTLAQLTSSRRWLPGRTITKLYEITRDDTRGTHVTCGEATRNVLEQTIGPVPGMEHLPVWKTTPAALCDALLGFKSYSAGLPTCGKC